MTNPAYASYLRSSTWISRRRAYYETHERKCQACFSARSLHLHHLTYARVGAEEDTDLVILCARCHQRAHELARGDLIGFDLRTLTHQMIYEARSGRVAPRPTAPYVRHAAKHRRQREERFKNGFYDETIDAIKTFNARRRSLDI